MGLNNYEKYRRLLEGVLGQPIPWVLDDLDPATTFDEDVRKRVQAAIDVLRGILNGSGLVEGSEKYKEKLAVGLFWLAAVPDKETLSDKNINAESLAKKKMILDMIKDDLGRNGLSAFWDYLIQNGGFRVEGDYSEEYDALTALKKRQGECTEMSKILFGIFKMAGLEPIFVKSENSFKIIEEIKKFKLAKYFAEQLNNWPPGREHVWIGHWFGGRLRFFDSSHLNSDADYKGYYPLSLRQYLSLDLTNRGNAWYEKGSLGKALVDYSAAVKINPKNDSAYTNRGAAWGKKGEPDNAIIDYSAAITINSKNDLAHYNRGGAWYKKGELEKAITDYSVAIKINSKYDVARYNRGIVYVIKGRYADAVIDFSVVFEISNLSFDRVLKTLSNVLKTTWQKDPKMTQILNVFTEDVGIDMALVESYFILSYALWNADKKAAAKKAFFTAAGAIIFKKLPSPSTKEFLKEMLAVMPPSMKMDDDVRGMIKIINNGLH